MQGGCAGGCKEGAFEAAKVAGREGESTGQVEGRRGQEGRGGGGPDQRLGGFRV
jgi:hypothetical protein